MRHSPKNIQEYLLKSAHPMFPRAANCFRVSQFIVILTLLLESGDFIVYINFLSVNQYYVHKYIYISTQYLYRVNCFVSQRESSGVRVAFIPNTDGAKSTDQSINKVVIAALATLQPAEATKYVVRLLEDEGCHERQDCDILVCNMIYNQNSISYVLKK